MIKYSEDLSDILVTKKDRVFIIDANVYKLYTNLFVSIKENAGKFIFDATELNKNLESVNELYQFFLKNNVNRDTLIIGIGGGITTDIAGFAASTFKRGCRLVLIPTTVLSMVDAAIGGKSGVNHSKFKNNIGNFYQSDEIIINYEFLKSLSKSMINEGFIEIVKMSFLPKTKLPELLDSNADIEVIIKEAIDTKLKICNDDLYDKGKRNLLNLGHTFGHVLESISSYEISHGTAVAIGMRAAAEYSYLKGFITEKIVKLINARLDNYELPKTFDNKYVKCILDSGEEVLKQDKKASDKLKLILYKDIDKLFIYKTEFNTDILNVLIGFADD